MSRLKNNFIWKFALHSKFQNPIEKFDREFWGKVGKLASLASPSTSRSGLKPRRSGSVEEANGLFVRKPQESILQKSEESV